MGGVTGIILGKYGKYAKLKRWLWDEEGSKWMGGGLRRKISAGWFMRGRYAPTVFWNKDT